MELSTKLRLYGTDGSAPVRAVLLTLKTLSLPYDYVQVDLFAQEQLANTYVQRNPQHTVPTLELNKEGGASHSIWDSHAIMAYLVSAFGQNDALYPRELLQRALVDQRLHFDSSVLFPALTAISVPLFEQKCTKIASSCLVRLKSCYQLMESFLQEHWFVAGPALTIADFSTFSSLNNMSAFAAIDALKHPKLTAWMGRIEQLPCYDPEIQKDIDFYKQLIAAQNIET